MLVLTRRLGESFNGKFRDEIINCEILNLKGRCILFSFLYIVY